MGKRQTTTPVELERTHRAAAKGLARDSATTGSKTDRGGDRLVARRGGREATGSSDMTSALASQLQVVAASRPQEERLRGKASLLYDIREAADIDLQTIYSVGLQGTRASYRNPRRARRVSVPRRARARNIQPRNRRRRPLSGGGLRFSRSAAVGRRARVCNPLTARSMRDPALTIPTHSHRRVQRAHQARWPVRAVQQVAVQSRRERAEPRADGQGGERKARPTD